MMLLVYNMIKFQIFFIDTMAKLKVIQNQLISYEKSRKNISLIDLLSPYTLNIAPAIYVTKFYILRIVRV